MAPPSHYSSQNGDTWFSVGLASSFPNIAESGSVTLSDSMSCNDDNSTTPGCKVFFAPDTDSDPNKATQLSDDPKEQVTASLRRGEQVLVFQYAGKFHAMDNKCPHSSYPLSNGTPFDIEDFGIVLSAGITCPKHGWSFDLFTGRADRGNYRLKLWEVQLRSVSGTNDEDSEQEVWVRKKQRIG